MATLRWRRRGLARRERLSSAMGKTTLQSSFTNLSRCSRHSHSLKLTLRRPPLTSDLPAAEHDPVSAAVNWGRLAESGLPSPTSFLDSLRFPSYSSLVAGALFCSLVTALYRPTAAMAPYQIAPA